MGTPRILTEKRTVIFLITVASIFIFHSLWNFTLTNPLGGGDFWGYWSATYLLRNGQNPYDPQAMALVQTTQMDTGLDFTIMAWNPPSLFVVLLPLSLFPITSAIFIWLIINLTLVTTTILLLTKLYFPQGHAKLNLTFLFFAFIMPQILAGIYIGQITILVSFGLVACMALIKKNQWFWAGAILILTSIKPHLVVLSVLYLLIYITQKRKLQGWVGFFAASIVCLFVLFTLRPQLVSDFIGLSKIAPTKWYTPTIGGWLSFIRTTEIARYMIVLLLPMPFFLAKYPTKFSMEFSVALLTLITVPTTFFGWGYDQAILLIPISQVFQWLHTSQNKPLIITITSVIIVALGINYYQRIAGIYEVYYVWVPLLWCLIFGTVWYYTQRPTYSHD